MDPPDHTAEQPQIDYRALTSAVNINATLHPLEDSFLSDFYLSLDDYTAEPSLHASAMPPLTDGVAHPNTSQTCVSDTANACSNDGDPHQLNEQTVAIRVTGCSHRLDSSNGHVEEFLTYHPVSPPDLIGFDATPAREVLDYNDQSDQYGLIALDESCGHPVSRPMYSTFQDTGTSNALFSTSGDDLALFRPQSNIRCAEGHPQDNSRSDATLRQPSRRH